MGEEGTGAGGFASRTLEFARRLQGIRSIPELVTATQSEIRESLGYGASWIGAFEDEALERCRVWSISGGSVDPDEAADLAFRTRDDRMITEIVDTQQVVVVEDARTDPRTDKQMVERFQNRTIIHVPLRLLEEPLGFFAVGSFGEQGVLKPSPEALDYLVQIAAHLSVALGRIQLLAEQEARKAEQLDHERVLARTQRLESVGLLAGGIAHDFNNLLTVILSSATLLKMDDLDPDQGEEVHAVIDAAERAADLCARLLALGRGTELRLEPLDLEERVASLMQLIGRLMRGVEVETTFGADLPPARGDGGQLDQVIMNLCLNARDALPEGGKLRVGLDAVEMTGATLRAHPWALPGTYLRLTFADDGPGIPPDVLERIFEPFFTTKSAGTGSGLGLAVSYGIVRQHGGMLQCHSEVGRGTTFRVFLPAHERRRAAFRVAPTTERPGAGQRILVAGNDEALRELMTIQLERAGYEAVAVADGARAVEAAEARPFDLAILDTVMPVMGGREARARIAAARPQTRVLFVGGYAPEPGSTDEPAQAAGAGDILPKPHREADLIEAVRRALDPTAP